MDPRHSAQDVLRCNLCKTELAPLYCNVCHTHLCKNCVAIHLSDQSTIHTVVPFEQFLSSLNSSKCQNHPQKHCELHCKQCNISICSNCISSGQHSGHKILSVFEDSEAKKEVFKQDLQEIENVIFPKYKEAAFNIQIQRADWKKNSKKLTADLKKHGKALHKEIDIIIENKQAEIDDMDKQQKAVFDKTEDVISRKINKLEGVIQDLKKLLVTTDVCLISKYKYRIKKIRKMPPKLHIALQTFQHVEINREQLLKQFGSVTSSSNTTEEDYPDTTFPSKQMLDVPLLITELSTRYEYLYGVSCLSDDEIWTHGNNNIIRLFTLKGDLLKSIQTKLGNVPADIAVTGNKNLVYSDYDDGSINIVSGTQIQTLITLRGWKPGEMCSTSSSDNLLVIMECEEKEETKIVRFSASTEKNSIQWDDSGKPIFSYGGFKYLSENKNLDICVADNAARAIVVVNAAGKLRFRYTGHPTTTHGPFCPRGITTDSQAKILTADYDNNCIHIIHQNGHFLRYIDKCGLQRPRDLCVDSKDNVFVAERNTSKVKIIQYYK